MANLRVGAIETGGMTMRAALTPEQRIAIYDRHRRGESLASIAQDLGIHYETARKWWRIGRRCGRDHLAERPRKCPGLLRDVPQAVVKRIVVLRQEHRESWGVPYLREQLLRDAELSPKQRAQVPSLSTLYRFFRRIEGRTPRTVLVNEIPSVPLLAQADYPHHLWQMDLKEKCRVKGLSHQITVLNARDVYSSVTVGAEVFELKRRNATLSGRDVQSASRACFARFGLPEILRTDKGTCFAAQITQNGFPSHFTLWLVGLGIRHDTIERGQVTQNGCIERFNRTYSSLVLRDGPFRDLKELQERSTQTIRFLNESYPSRAGSCDGRAPLQAHPTAAKPRRPYTPDDEARLFDLSRVDAYLARFRWQRRADCLGKVSVGNRDYYLGRAHRRRVFDVTFDPTDRHFVFQTPDRTVSLRRRTVGFDSPDLLDIKPPRKRRRARE
jgi:transposase InsO family protein